MPGLGAGGAGPCLRSARGAGATGGTDTAREPEPKTRVLAVPELRSVCCVGPERVRDLLARPTLGLGIGFDSDRVSGRKSCCRPPALIRLDHCGRDTTARRNLVAVSSSPLTNCGGVVPSGRRGTGAALAASGAAAGTTGCPGVRSQNVPQLRSAFRAQVDLEVLAVEGEGDRLISLATIQVVDEPYARDACHLSLPSVMPSRVTQFSTPGRKCQITRGCGRSGIPVGVMNYRRWPGSAPETNSNSRRSTPAPELPSRHEARAVAVEQQQAPRRPQRPSYRSARLFSSEKVGSSPGSKIDSIGCSNSRAMRKARGRLGS